MLLLGLVVFGCVVLACVCTADLECQYFEPNTYCFVDTKYLCPAHSSSPAGSDDVSEKYLQTRNQYQKYRLKTE